MGHAPAGTAAAGDDREAIAATIRRVHPGHLHPPHACTAAAPPLQVRVDGKVMVLQLLCMCARRLALR